MYVIRTLLELFGYALLTGVILLLVLVVGQWVKLADLVGTTGHWSDWLRVLSLTGLALMEAALPLVGLIAAGLVYGRRRTEGAVIGYGALGWGPLRVYGPAMVFGLGCGLGAAWLAARPVPDALRSVHRTVAQLVVENTLQSHQSVPLGQGGALVREGGGGALWIATSQGDGAPTLIRAAQAHGRLGVAPATSGVGPSARKRVGRQRAGEMTALVVEANDVWLWGAGLRAHVDTARVVLSDPKLSRRLGSLGPPNSLPTADLDRTDVHHRFTWHRRLALPSMAPLWALIGALLGARLGGARALLCGAAAVTSCYWLLRAGELAARDGFGSAAVAAWAPALTLGLVTALVIRRV